MDGGQAANLKLVDSHGDFVDAVRKVAEMGGLETDETFEISVMNVYEKDGRYLPPRPFETASPQMSLCKTWPTLARLLLGDNIAAFNGRPLLLMPFKLRLSS
ncbi:MAG: hypothetical protein M5U34_29975 [Chloroflexi bacterium]|nr:hypothetical protein [Chloroflexota bacterium]